VTITYASEVMPVALRQYLTTYVNFCWGLGQVIGVGVVKSQLGRTDDLAWQLPYYLQLMWPPLLGGLILFAPESPWWLVRRGKYEEAKKSLHRLTNKKLETGFDADQSIAMMKHTIEMEAQVSSVVADGDNVANHSCRSRKAPATSTVSVDPICDEPKLPAWFGLSRTCPATHSPVTRRKQQFSCWTPQC
jgi:MFS family permease